MSQLALDLGPDASRRKELGAFYTPEPMAQLLVDWALRSSTDRVIDPSFGGLVFLRAASSRLESLGTADPWRQIFGCEFDPHAFAQGLSQDGVLPSNLCRSDFLKTSPGNQLPQVEAVVGNPPYVRYQGFNGSGTTGQDLADRVGVKLTRLASSWAPFVVHGTAFVAPGGRMAQVLPAEILHAQYAGEVLDFLQRSFASVSLVLFEERVFPGALEEVVLLFADGRGESAAPGVTVHEAKDLLALITEGVPTPSPSKEVADGSSLSLLAQLLPPETRELFEQLAASTDVHRLGEIASVDIGAVTGGNDFFVIGNDEARVPLGYRRRAVTKAAFIPGAKVTSADLDRLADTGKRVDLLTVDPEVPREALDDLEAYLVHGEASEIHKRFKCRVRSPWWSVPRPRQGAPDAFLTYCSSEHPRFVVNEAEAVHTNTVHGVSMRDGYRADGLAGGFINSLTLLSAELAGRSYGGGVLKLEPTEAEALVLPAAALDQAKSLREVDELLRRRDLGGALDLVDRAVLGKDGLGLSHEAIDQLRAGAEKLRSRRRARGKAPRSL